MNTVFGGMRDLNVPELKKRLCVLRTRQGYHVAEKKLFPAKQTLQTVQHDLYSYSTKLSICEI